MNIRVRVQENSYSVHVKNGISSQIPLHLKKLALGNFCVVITNKKIASLQARRIKKITQGIPSQTIYVPDGERAKSPKWVFNIIQELLSVDRIGRRIFILCVGGGVIGDLGAFVASIYKRGIPYIQIPTTLLAQVDASIGGKTAINLEQGKNLVGSFYQPKAVFIDPQFLYTLTKKHIQQGLAEIIKYALIQDKDLFKTLQSCVKEIRSLSGDRVLKIITRCVAIKAMIVAKDEKEKKGIRTLLNFGHTIGHALEATTEYRKTLTHGDAIALGMISASHISLYLGMCARTEVVNIEHVIEAYGLPCSISFNKRKLMKNLAHDKKFISGSIRMVLLSKVGKAQVVEKIPLSLIEKSLGAIAR